MKLTDMIAKAKDAESAEALLAMAKENGLELSEEDAKCYFAQLHRKGEISDDELEDVSGGQCKNGDKYVVIATQSCEEWKCPKCGGHLYDSIFVSMLHDCSDGKTKQAICDNCVHCSYERGLWLCDNTKFWDNIKYTW